MLEKLDAEDVAFAIFATTFVIGAGLVWFPLGLLATSLVALLVSVSLARSDRANGG